MFYLMDFIKGQFALFAPLQRNMVWKKFGFKYFNPEDRTFFATAFKQSYLALDVEKAVEGLSQIFN